MITALIITIVIVPIIKMDNNQHHPDENSRIGNMSHGIKTCMVILTMRI